VAVEILTESLTEREIEVMAHVAEGESTKEIARALGISPHTVASHVRSVCRKVDESSRWAALVKARRMGLFPACTGEPPRNGTFRGKGCGTNGR
jgi:DNA-binding CsgD family transcriptional regulator